MRAISHIFRSGGRGQKSCLFRGHKIGYFLRLQCTENLILVGGGGSAPLIPICGENREWKGLERREWRE